MMTPELSQQAGQALYALRFELEPEQRAELVEQIEQAQTYDELPEQVRQRIPAPTN